MNPKQLEMLNRAKQYPYELPYSSYLFLDGERIDIKEIDFECFSESILSIHGADEKLGRVLAARGICERLELQTLIPILAVGSNASCEQLARKFCDGSHRPNGWRAPSSHVVVPVIRAKLSDFDVVYSAHFTRYGSIPATLVNSTDTLADLFLTFLNRALLDRMHQTEAEGTNYAYRELTDINLLLEERHLMSRAFSYFTLHGLLSLSGSPVAVSAIHAERRLFQAMDEVGILTEVMRLFDAGTSLDEFILQNIQNPTLRSERGKLLPRIQT